jgi:hypothetical protein
LDAAYEKEQDILENSKKAGEEIKDAAKAKAKSTKNKITVGLAGAGIVVGTVATMGVGGAIIGGVAGGFLGRAVGKKKESIEKA